MKNEMKCFSFNEKRVCILFIPALFPCYKENYPLNMHKIGQILRFTLMEMMTILLEIKHFAISTNILLVY